MTAPLDDLRDVFVDALKLIPDYAWRDREHLASKWMDAVEKFGRDYDVHYIGTLIPANKEDAE